MNTHDFDDLRAARPTPPAPADAVVRQAREALMQQIEAEGVSTVRPLRSPGARPAWHGRVRIGLAAATILAVTGIGTAVVVSGHGSSAPAAISTTASPNQALEEAARLVAYTSSSQGSGPIRHIRFQNLTDPGNPTYDTYIRPNGSAMVGTPGKLEASDGYLTSAEIEALPSDPIALRAAMTGIATKHGYGVPGQVEERALFRLAIDLLSDPGTSPAVKGAVYRVIAGFDLAAVHARNIGATTDKAGRSGIGLVFGFEEGVTERVVIDQKTGALLSDTSTLPDGEPFGGQVYLTQERVADIPGR